jgi:hypothetical protein
MCRDNVLLTSPQVFDGDMATSQKRTLKAPKSAKLRQSS